MGTKIATGSFALWIPLDRGRWVCFKGFPPPHLPLPTPHAFLPSSY
jgi:hypothetical protein